MLVCCYIQVKRIYVPLPDENVRRLLLKNQLKGQSFKLPGELHSLGDFFFIETFYRYVSMHFNQSRSLLDWITASFHPSIIRVFKSVAIIILSGWVFTKPFRISPQTVMVLVQSGAPR